MSDAILATKTEVEIPRSFLEYTLNFEAPVLKAWQHRDIISQVLPTLKSSGFSLDGVDLKFQSEKLNEHAIIFRRTSPASPPVSIAVLLGKIFIAAENLDWSEAESFISAMTTAIHAIREATGGAVQSQHVGLGIHIQLKNKPTKDVTAPLVSAAARELMDGDITFSGVIISRAKSNITIELSAQYANALWVRMFREHSASATLPEIASTLRKDEEQLFRVLALEGVL